MILITGGTGFLGYHLLQSLSQQGIGLRAIYRSNSNPEIISQFPNVEWIETDLLDVIGLEDAMQGVSQIYHCAAIVSFDPRAAEQMLKTNIEGTGNIVDLALKLNIEKLIYVSSIVAIGKKEGSLEVKEENEWDANQNVTNYGKSKHGAEMEVWRGMAEGLNAAIVNPSIILGEWDWNKGTAVFFKRAFKQPLFYVEGVKGFVDVKDVVKAMELLMQSNISGERFIINAENLPLRQVFDWIADDFDKKKARFKAGAFLLRLASFAESIRSKLSGQAPQITSETIKLANSKYQYDNTKFKTAFPNFEYQSIRGLITRVCQSINKNQ